MAIPVNQHCANCIGTLLFSIGQGWANYGPRAACCPPEYIMRAVGMYVFHSSRTLSKTVNS